MQYVLPLKPADTASTRRMTTLHLMLAFVLCGIGAGCLVLYWFTGTSPNFPTAYKPFAILGLCSLLAGLAIALTAIFNKKWLMQGKRSLMLRVVEVLVVAAVGLGFVLADQLRPATLFGVIALAILMATIWEMRKPAAQQVTIDEEGISLPKGGASKHIEWTEIEGVILRHSILSIELTGNRLVQRQVEGDHDVQSIEAFSQELIRKHEKERTKAVW